ncbi:MAG: hypothetical protein HC809_16695, partial [Gammaproteobacteria bacterium]|nr:hypothetical protein [Gammaproteobacteria bacterium]
MLRSVIAVIMAPIVWGVVMLPGNMLLLVLFPGADVEPRVGYLVAALVGSVIYSLIAGVTTAFIIGRNAKLHGIWAGIALLAVGVMVQVQAWDVLPLWYHLVFLTLLVPACVAGAVWAGRRRG